MEEEWRDVINYEGLYQISNLGRLKRIGKARGAVVGRILSDRATRNGGYIVNGLWKDEKMTLFAVHRIVAENFLGPAPSDRHIVAHSDGNPKNNAASNLRWATLAENTYDQVIHGTNSGKFYGRPSALTDEQILAIRADHRSGAIIGPEYGIAQGTVHQIRQRKTHRHLPPMPGDFTGAKSTKDFSDDVVRRIRQDPRSTRKVAKDYGVGASTIGAIKRKESYSHVPD